MNKFIDRILDKEVNLDLRDVISWEKEGKASNNYMIFKNTDETVGLVNIDKGVAVKYIWESLSQLKDYFLTRKIDNNVIHVIKSNDWTLYVP